MNGKDRQKVSKKLKKKENMSNTASTGSDEK